MRAEFRIWHDKDDFYHIMFDQSTLQRYRVDVFPDCQRADQSHDESLTAIIKKRRKYYIKNCFKLII